MTEENWELIQIFPRCGVENYVTKNVQDEELSKHNISEIVWTRIWDPEAITYRKIMVPFTPDDEALMEKTAKPEIERRERILERAYKKWLAKQNAVLQNQ